MTDPPLAAPRERRILVVEDDPEYLEMLRTLCAREGFQVESATNGTQVMSKISDCKPDMVILDLMLPGIGGFEVLRALRAESIGIPVIVITARHMDQGMVQMIREEPIVADFMTKPFKTNALACDLHRLLRTAPPEIGLSAGS